MACTRSLKWFDDESKEESRKESGTIQKRLSRTEEPAVPDNYQKKIVPWESALLDVDLDLSQFAGTVKKRSNLILMASLIDKIPNIAGLCRTCEIFNVACMTVQRKEICEDRMFPGISVASEKWLPIVEVRFST